MLSIDEAIAHARLKAKEIRENIIDGDNLEPYESYYNAMVAKSAEEHEQRAEWLEELKALRNGLKIKCDSLNDALEKGKKIGYKKAIDDFEERLIEELSHTTLLKDGYYLANIIKPLAEQLKEGVNINE